MKSVLLSTLLLFSPIAFAAPADIVVALKPDKNPEAMSAERVALEKFLTDKMGRQVKVIVPLSGAVIQEGLAGRTIDVAFISGLEMIKAEKAGAGELLAATEIEGKTSYESYWVTLKDKPYDDVTDLKGKSVAFASRTSTSGYLVPVADLINKKLLKPLDKPEAFFGEGNVSFGTGYVSAIERVLAGQAEAAAVSDYVMLRDKHLTAEQKAKLKVMAKQGPVPTHMLAVRKSLDAKGKEELRKAFLALNEKTELRDRVFTSKIVKTTSDKQLASLKKALNETGIVLD